MRTWYERHRGVLAISVGAFLLVLLGASWGAPGSGSTPARVIAGTGPVRHVVVALGDSVSAGAACSCTPFPELYGSLLARRTGAEVDVTNEAVNGLDTAGLLAQLEQSQVAAAVSRADVVLVTIGANDFGDRHDDVVEGRCTAGREINCVDVELGSMRAHLTRILRGISSLRKGRPTSILVTGYWNVFEDEEVAKQSFGLEGFQASIALTHQVNAGIRAVSARAGARFIDLFAPFHSPGLDEHSLLAEDGDHPDAAGHELIANTLMGAGLPRTG